MESYGTFARTCHIDCFLPYVPDLPWAAPHLPYAVSAHCSCFPLGFPTEQGCEPVGVMKLRFEFTIPDRTPQSNTAQPDERSAAELANKIYRFRRRRAAVLGGLSNLFGEPAWDMLLDLYTARIALQRVSVTSLCIAADVPPTTALRWIALLESEGLIERYPDPSDRRRTYIRLNDKMTAAMTRLLSG